MIQQTLISLLQIAMGQPVSLSNTLTDDQWNRVLQLSIEQRVVAIVFVALEQNPHLPQPPRRVKVEWALQTDRVRKGNERLDKLCKRAFANLSSCQLPCVILKGQGNGANYPAVLEGNRYPGDIDIWAGCNSDEVIRFAYEQSVPREGIRYNHVDLPVISDVTIELHYRPSFVCHPLFNHRLQKWLKKEWQRSPWCTYKDFTIADNRFNVIYHLVHLFRHLFEGEITLRQLVDYLFVLKHLPADLDRHEVECQIEALGLTRFARGVMWMLLQLDGSVEPIVAPDEKEGTLLWQSVWSPSHVGKLRVDMQLLFRYPGEALSEPVFRLWHALWRCMKKITH